MSFEKAIRRGDIMKDDSECKDMDFLKKVWKNVKKATQSQGIINETTQKTLKHTSPTKKDNDERDHHSVEVRSHSRVSGFLGKNEYQRGKDSYRLVKEKEPNHKRTNLSSTAHNVSLLKNIPLDKIRIDDESHKKKLNEMTSMNEVLKLRIDHYKSEVSKKDAEIVYLRGKLKEHRKVTKELETLNTEPLELMIELSRLKENNKRLLEIISEPAPSSVLCKVYSPCDQAFLSLAVNQKPCSNSNSGKPPLSSKQNKSRMIRECCSSHQNQTQSSIDSSMCGIKDAKFCAQELVQWVPKDVHKLYKMLTDRLELSIDKDRIIKDFLVQINHAYLSREKEVLDKFIKRYEKEVKELKKQVLDKPIEMKNRPGEQKKKSDKQAFMEGASWILTKIQADFNGNSNIFRGVIDNLNSSPEVILKAMIFATEGLEKIRTKMSKYEQHISANLTNENATHEKDPVLIPLPKRNNSSQSKKLTSASYNKENSSLYESDKSRHKSGNGKAGEYGIGDAEVEAFELDSINGSTLY